jgi:hypothetical protein
MSRADAQQALREIRATLPEFSTPDAPPATLQEVSALAASHGILQDSLDRGDVPNAPEIRKLRARLAELQYARLLASNETEPRTTQAAVITLYGIAANDTTRAATLAAMELHGEYAPELVLLQARSHVRRATLTGTRYIFTTHTP